MRRALLLVASLTLLLGFASSGVHSQAQQLSAFKSAELISAPGGFIPSNSVANGVVLLTVTLDRDGAVRNVQVTHELASISDQAVATVKRWKFAPAMLNGKPVTSRIAVTVVICPIAVHMPHLDVPDVSPPADAGGRLAPPTQLPGIAALDYVPSPTSVAGLVVLQTLISPTGALDDAKVVRTKTGFTDAVLQSVKERWKFTPATVDGAPVASNIVIAFAFRSPYPNWP
jgi:TonB family protein